MSVHKTLLLTYSIRCIFQKFIQDALSIKNPDTLFPPNKLPAELKPFVSWVKQFNYLSPAYSNVDVGVFEPDSEYLMIREFKKVFIEEISRLSPSDHTHFFNIFSALIQTTFYEGKPYKIINFIDESRDEANQDFWEFKIGDYVLVQLPDDVDIYDIHYEVIGREQIVHEGIRHYFYLVLSPDQVVYRIHENFVYHQNAKDSSP